MGIGHENSKGQAVQNPEDVVEVDVSFMRSCGQAMLEPGALAGAGVGPKDFQEQVTELM